MNRLIAYAALAGVAGIGVSIARATEIETFDSPNQLQDPAKNGGSTNYALSRDGGAFNAANATVVQTFGQTFYGLSTQPLPGKPGYGTGYHNIYSQNFPPPAGSPNNPNGTLTNGVIDISGNTDLQLDVTINNGTDAGLFIDLLDGAGDFYKYFYGYGRTGNAVADSAAGLLPGETITQGALPNEEIMRVPLATPYADINGSGMFDFTQLTLYRIENDPGTPNGVGNPSDVSFYDLSAVTVAAGPSIWNVNGGGDWNTAANWANTTIPNGADAEADFFGVITAPATISTAVGVTTGTLNFNNTNSYTIGGAGSLTLQTTSGNAQVIVQAGTQKLNLPVTVASNTVFNVSSGASLQVLSPLTVNAGESLTQTGTGTVSYQSTISVLGGGSIAFGNASHATGLSLASGATASIAPHATGGPIILQIDSVSFADTTSKFNLTNNELITTAPAASVRGNVIAGQLFTSSTGGGLGYLDIGGGKTEVRFTLLGDTNLDGSVNVSDLGNLATNFGVTTGAAWIQGDFDYNGAVNVADLGDLATNFGATVPGGAEAGATSQAAASAELSQAVPEPTSMAALSLAAAGTLLRRRRIR